MAGWLAAVFSAQSLDIVICNVRLLFFFFALLCCLLQRIYLRMCEELVSYTIYCTTIGVNVLLLYVKWWRLLFTIRNGLGNKYGRYIYYIHCTRTHTPSFVIGDAVCVFLCAGSAAEEMCSIIHSHNILSVNIAGNF